MAELYELKQNLGMVGAQLKKINDDLQAKVANPNVAMDEVTALKAQKADLQERFNIIKGEHDTLEAEQRATLQQRQQIDAGAKTDAEKIVAAKAEFFRAAIQNRPMSQDAIEVFNQLQALPAPTVSGGENFLPTTMSNVLVSEPFARNPLRGVIGTTNIGGLELPRISFKLDDDDFVGDDETAKELVLSGDKVTFGRKKFKVFAAISDTVIHGSDVGLVGYVENALRSGLAAKEKKVSFAVDLGIKVGEEHMTFYQVDDEGDYIIPAVTGATLYEAVTNAIAKLHEDFRDNAKVCMAYADYVTMLKELANQNMTLYSAPPEQVIGKPVVFCDSATTPIVGDFTYAHLNYDGELVYDTDKDVKSGDYLFVITAWIDQKRKLNSAFRLAIVEPVV